jgi:hypothetical protein
VSTYLLWSAGIVVVYVRHLHGFQWLHVELDAILAAIVVAVRMDIVSCVYQTVIVVGAGCRSPPPWRLSP